jgi:hypothetical protein
VAINIATNSKDFGCDWDNYENSDKWRHMWERVETMIHSQNFMSILGNVVKGTLKDMVFAYANRPPASDISSDVDSETDDDNEITEPHVFKLMVSMEEVHAKKSRKVRLFLNEFPKDPFYVNIDFDCFPEMIYYHKHSGVGYKIIIEMKLKPHPVYYWDNLLNEWDIYTTVPITLSEYFTGCRKQIPNIDTTTSFAVSITPFPDMKKSICYKGMGLQKKGDLYIVLEIRLPTKKEWKQMENNGGSSVLELFMNACKKIEISNATDDVSS